jgi:putative transcriptional regulator
MISSSRGKVRVPTLLLIYFMENQELPFFSSHPPYDRVPAVGKLLLAQPFMGDANFERGVVLLCEYSSKGAFGLTLNQSCPLNLDDVLEQSIYPNVPLFVGGPVAQNTLHFIHRRLDLLASSVRLGGNLGWSTDFEEAFELLNQGQLHSEDVRFFIGYSGWSAGQLDNEIRQDAWILTRTPTQLLFETPHDQLWRQVLRQMGGDFRIISHYPTDPRLN